MFGVILFLPILYLSICIATNRSETLKTIGEVLGVASKRQVMLFITLLYLIMFSIITVTCSG
jgi:hypothetical protein